MICAPIIAASSEEAVFKMARADPGADVLEIRLDLMASFHVKKLVQSASRPVIVTYRSKGEGGKGSAGVETRARYLMEAVHAGADFVDVEFSMPLSCRRKIFEGRGRTGIILSAHLLEGTPARGKLEDLLREMAATGAEKVKIVTRARAVEDNLRILNLIPLAQRLDVGIIAFCMGPLGRISRIASPVLGGDLTFAALSEGEESADGQLPLKEMKKILEVLSP